MNKARLIILAGLIGCLALLSLMCGPKDKTVLATFDGGAVHIDDYIEYYLSASRHKPEMMPTEEDLRKTVSIKAMEKIAILEARERGLDQDKEFVYALEERKRRILFYRYMQEQVIPSVITDSLIQAYYDHFSPQYNIKYIIRPVVETSTPEFAEAQKDTIEHVYRLLKSGRPFESLANDYSQDITTNKKGGDLGYVIRESLGDAKLRAVMDTLSEYAYSEPFRGYNGYYILYKGESRTVPVPPFEEARPKIWRSLYKTRQHVIKDKVENQFENISKEYNLVIHEDVIDQINQKAGAAPGSSTLKLLEYSSELDQKDMERVLASYDGGVVKVYDLFKVENKEPDNALDFRDRLIVIAQQQIMGMHAESLGLDETPEIQEQIQMIRAALLRNELSIITIRNKVDARIDSLREEHKDELTEGELHRLVQKRQWDFEREIKAQFEERMKEKYNFEWVTGNFDRALDQARQAKEEQNLEMEKAKS